MQSNALGQLPHWDLSNVYPGLESEPFKQAVAELIKQLDALDAYMAEHHIAGKADAAQMDSAALNVTLGGYLDRRNELLKLFRTLHAYVNSFVSADSHNTAAKRIESELDMLGPRVQQQNTRFTSWIGSLAEALPGILEHGGSAQAHAFYLREAAEQSRYLMSDAEESLASELGLSGHIAWSKMQGTICSQLTVPFERNGQVTKMAITALQNLKTDPDADVRRRAYEAELAVWKSVREPLAAAMNGIKGAGVTLNRRRGRVDALHQALDQSRIDRATLETMLGAMRDSFPVFRQYMRAKAAKLGEGALPWWDIEAPVGKSERRYTFAEAQDFILTNFSTFSDRLASLARRAFEQRWIDAEPREGKRGGAFCMAVPRVDESRVLCNYGGALDHVSTVAHELGHAFHNECKTGKTMLQGITPMTLAETASIFCETIVTDAALKQAASRDEELAILETFLASANQVIVDISSRFMFEQEVFERRAKSELSADDFCGLMLEAQRATYGDGLDGRYLHPYMWAWKPHYYRTDLSFYNYPYAFGLLFGLGLYAIYQARGKSFIPEYEALLASTGEGTAADLAARFGIDIRRPEFWQGSLKLIETRIHRYAEL